VIALPLIDGPRVPGLPSDESGFIPIDSHARVRGVEDVYAAGDGTNFPIKQGGIATQQADAAAEHIAGRAGADIEPGPFRPVLRGKLLTGRGSRFLRHELGGGADEGTASDFKLWFPPTKVSGKYLSQWLPRLDEAHHPPAPGEPHVEIEVPLPSTDNLGQRGMLLSPYSPV